MDFSIPEDLRMLQMTVRRYVQEVLMPMEQEYMKVERLPYEVVDDLEQRVKDMGLWALDVPTEYGGGDVSTMGMCLVSEELHKAMLPTHPTPWHGFGPHVYPILYGCKGDQIERFLLPVIRGEKHPSFAQTEPNAGSDPASIETTAVRSGDNYILNGTKTFIMGSERRTDFWMVLATVDRSKGRAGITCFVVERGTPGFSIVREIKVFGGAFPFELALQDCVVPAKNRIGEEGEGFALGQRFLGRARLGFGPRTVGMGERCLEMSVRYAKQRVTFGRPIADRQAIQWMLADSAVEIHATRMLAYHCAWMADQKMDIRDAAARVKLWAAETAGRVTDRAIQIHGSLGMTDDMPLTRLWINTRHQRIGEGTSEMMRFIIARNLLRD